MCPICSTSWKKVYSRECGKQFTDFNSITFSKLCLNSEIIQNLLQSFKSILKILFSIDFLATLSLNMLSIRQKIIFNVLVMIQKIILGLMPQYLYENLIFTSDVHGRNTRQNEENKLRLPNYRLEMTRRNVFYNGINTN